MTSDRRSLRAAPTSRASSRGCILRAPGGPVELDRHTARGGPGLDQFERPAPAGVREQPRALADDHGEGEQVDLVDELARIEEDELPTDVEDVELESCSPARGTEESGVELGDGRIFVMVEELFPDVAAWFDALCFSYEVMSTKPEPRAFLATLERLDVTTQ